MSDSEDCVQGCSPYSNNARKAAKKMSCAEILAKILGLTVPRRLAAWVQRDWCSAFVTTSAMI